MGFAMNVPICSNQSSFSGALLSALIGLFCATTTPVASAVDWQPSSFQWTCTPQASGERLCSLVAFGVEPAGTASVPIASGWFRVHKGTVAGSGQVLATIPFNMPCVRESTNLRCTGTDLLRLADGLLPAITNNATNTSISVFGNSTPSLLFDWNTDNIQSASVEGILALRYMMGFTGDALFHGISLPAGADPADIERQIEMGYFNEWYSFPDVTTKSTTSGVLFVRCMLGLRGGALAGGFSSDEQAITNRCDQLTERR